MRESQGPPGNTIPVQSMHFQDSEGEGPSAFISSSRLSCCIRMMNLDSFWHAECNTISSHWSAFKSGLKVLERVGIPPPYQNLGPYPLTDTFGYGVALQMLLKSEEAGKQGHAYQQFTTIKQLHSAYSGVYYASAQGMAEGASYGQGKNQSFYMRCPTNSPWFVKFYSGCEKRMGKDLDANVALLGVAVREWLAETMQAIRESQDELEGDHLISVGAYVAVTYTASLRGHEMFMMDLAGVCKYIRVGQDHVELPHVIVVLLGWFKGETGEKYHLIPLPVQTNSGIKVGKWMEVVVAV